MPAIEIDAVTRVKTLIAVTEELTAIFAQENESIAARRPEEFSRFQEDKARLSSALESAVREIAADRSLVIDAGPALVERLRARMAEFEARAEEQRLLLTDAPAAPNAATA